MDHVRQICSNLHGSEYEQNLYTMHGHDMDEYIEMALQPPQAETGYTCKKCKQKSCSIQLFQTRSADEGMTPYVVCARCHHKRPFV